jgi:hypothetical protein
VIHSYSYIGLFRAVAADGGSRRASYSRRIPRIAVIWASVSLGTDSLPTRQAPVEHAPRRRTREKWIHVAMHSAFTSVSAERPFVPRATFIPPKSE